MVSFTTLCADDLTLGQPFSSLLLISWCLTIFFLSGQTISIPGPDFFFKDKILHAGAYGVMALLACAAFRTPKLPSVATRILAVIFSSLYGISDEWHQSFVAGRIPSVGDWIADTLGAILAVLLFFPAIRLMTQACDSNPDIR